MAALPRRSKGKYTYLDTNPKASMTDLIGCSFILDPECILTVTTYKIPEPRDDLTSPSDVKRDY